MYFYFSQGAVSFRGASASSQAQQFIQQLLAPEAAQRPDIGAVKKSPWLKKIDWGALERGSLPSPHASVVSKIAWDEGKVGSNDAAFSRSAGSVDQSAFEEF